MFLRTFAALIGAAFLTAGCAKPPEPDARLTGYRAAPAQPSKSPATAQGAVDRVALDTTTTGAIDAGPGGPPLMSLAALRTGYDPDALAGRTLKVRSQADLTLRPGEIVLTFDDGPSPAVTPLILKALDDQGVKAVFFMVGEMAEHHPETAQMVAASGQTIGTHTYDHPNLAKMTNTAAMGEIAHGERAVGKAIAPVGGKVAPFFRFPYLAQSQVLRADLRDMNLVQFGMEVDSLDYRHDTPQAVLQRTLQRLDRTGGGIVLFHDIHMRTAKLLPAFLKAIKARGYKVVHVVPAGSKLFDWPLTVAQALPPKPVTLSQ